MGEVTVPHNIAPPESPSSHSMSPHSSSLSLDWSDDSASNNWANPGSDLSDEESLIRLTPPGSLGSSSISLNSVDISNGFSSDFSDIVCLSPDNIQLPVNSSSSNSPRELPTVLTRGYT